MAAYCCWPLWALYKSYQTVTTVSDTLVDAGAYVHQSTRSLLDVVPAMMVEHQRHEDELHRQASREQAAMIRDKYNLH